MTRPVQKHYYTPEEYLAREEAAEYRSEYHRGEIFAMAGTSINHNRIAGNLLMKFNQVFAGKNCEAFMSEIKVWNEAEQFFAYPDVLVICGNPMFYRNRTDTITNHLIIVEILSASTQDYDRGDKLNFYRSLPSLKEYVLIAQYETYVERYFLDNTGAWLVKEYHAADAVLKFSSVDFQITLKELYERVKFT